MRPKQGLEITEIIEHLCLSQAVHMGVEHTHISNVPIVSALPLWSADKRAPQQIYSDDASHWGDCKLEHVYMRNRCIHRSAI